MIVFLALLSLVFSYPVRRHPVCLHGRFFECMDSFIKLIVEFSADDSSDVRVHIREVATGKMLSVDEAPKAEEVDAWLETHPGYEVVRIPFPLVLSCFLHPLHFSTHSTF